MTKSPTILTIILHNESKNYTLPGPQAEALFKMLKGNYLDSDDDQESEKDEIIRLLRSAKIKSIQRTDNRILIYLS